MLTGQQGSGSGQQAVGATWSNSPSGTQTDAVVPLTLTFNQSISGLTVANFVLGGDSMGASITSINGSGTTYQVNVAIPANAMGSLTVGLTGTITRDSDSSSQTIMAPLRSVVYDTRTPTITAQWVTSGPLTSTTNHVVLNFSESISGLTASNFVLSGDTDGVSISRVVLGVAGSPHIPGQVITSWTIFLVIPNDSTGEVNIGFTGTVNRESDDTSQYVSLASRSFKYDTRSTGVTASFSSSLATVSTSPTRIRINFDQSISGLTTANFVLGGASSGASIASVTGSGSRWSVWVNLPSESAGTLTINFTGTITRTSDSSSQSVTVSAGSIIYSTYSVNARFERITGIQKTDLHIDITFDQEVHSVSTSDFAITDANGATIDAPRAINGDIVTIGSTRVTVARVWRFRLNLPDNKTGTVGIAFTGTVQSRNSITIELGVGVSNIDVQYDTRPDLSATWSDEPSGTQTGSTVTIPVTFSEAISGFTAADVSILDIVGEGVTLAVNSVSTTVYNVVLSLPDNKNGTVLLEITGEVTRTRDSKSLVPTSTNRFVSYDTRKASDVTVTWKDIPTTIIPLTFAGFPVTLAFSENVEGLALADIRLISVDSDNTVTVHSGSITQITGGSGAKDYMVQVNPTFMSQDTVYIELIPNSVNIQGLSSEVLPATAVRSDGIRVDTRIATPTISAPSILQTASSVSHTITWDFDAEGFTQDDITISDSRVSITSLTKVSNKEYTLIVALPSTVSGSYIVSVNENALTEPPQSESGSSASTSYNTISDAVQPVITFGIPSGIQRGSFNVPIRFSELVSGLTVNEITVSHGTFELLPLMGTEFNIATINVTPPANNKGNIVVTVVQGAVQDSASTPNTNVETSSSPIPYDTELPAPSVVNYPSPQPVTTDFDISIIFNEIVAITDSLVSFIATDADGETTELTSVRTPTGTTESITHAWRVSGLPEGESGTVQMRLANRAAVDDTGNSSSQWVSESITFNTRGGVAVFDALEIESVDVPDGRVQSSPITVAVRFNKDPRGTPPSTDTTDLPVPADFTLDGLADGVASITSVVATDDPLVYNIEVALTDVETLGALIIRLNPDLVVQ